MEPRLEEQFVVFMDFLGTRNAIGNEHSAAAALRLGFLVRGGATIGLLYHAGGVVFGDAMVEAYEIEARTSVYPRVVLSPKVTARHEWGRQTTRVTKGEDGLVHIDYFHRMLMRAAPPGEDWPAAVKKWLEDVTSIITKKLAELETAGKLNEYSKWAWFSRRFRLALEKRPGPQILADLGMSANAIPIVSD